MIKSRTITKYSLISFLFLCAIVISVNSANGKNDSKISVLPKANWEIFNLYPVDGPNRWRNNHNHIMVKSVPEAKYGKFSTQVTFGVGANYIVKRQAFTSSALPSDSAELWMKNKPAVFSFFAKADHDIEMCFSVVLFIKESAKKAVPEQMFKTRMIPYNYRFKIKSGDWQQVVIPISKLGGKFGKFSLDMAKNGKMRLDFSRTVKGDMEETNVWIDQLRVVPLTMAKDAPVVFTEKTYNLFRKDEKKEVFWEISDNASVRPKKAELYVTGFANPSDIILKTSIVFNGAHSKQSITIPSNKMERFGPYDVYIDFIYPNGKRLRQKIQLGIIPKVKPDSSHVLCDQGDQGFMPVNITGQAMVRKFLYWCYAEPYKGEMDITYLKYIDEFVDFHHSHNTPVLLCVHGTPPWAIANEKKRKSVKPGKRSPLPPVTQAYLDFLGFIIDRYKGKIAGIEIWNEVNAPNYFNGTAEQYVNLLKPAYKFIKGKDKNIIVTGPCPTGDPIPFLQKFFALGGHKYLDVVSTHNYTSQTGPCAAGLEERLKYISGLLKKHGHKPHWDTEFGFFITPRYKRFPMTEERIDFLARIEPKKGSRKGMDEYFRNMSVDVCFNWSRSALTESQAANALVRQVAIGLANGLEKMFYFNCFAFAYCKDKDEMLPIGFAMFNVRNQFSGCVPVRRVDLGTNDQLLYEYKRKDGYLYLIWSVADSNVVGAKATSGLREIDIFGNEKTLVSQNGISLLKCDSNTRYIVSPEKVEFLPNPMTVKTDHIILGDSPANLSITCSNPFEAKSKGKLLIKANGKDVSTIPVVLSARESKETSATIAPSFLPLNVNSAITVTLDIQGVRFSATAHTQRINPKVVQGVAVQNDHPDLSDVGAMKIDSDRQWTEGRPSKFQSTHEDNCWRGKEDLSAVVRCGSDGKFLFFEVDVKDDEIVTDIAGPAWAKDSVEIYLDLRPPKMWKENRYSLGVFQIIIPAMKKSHSGELSVWAGKAYRDVFGAYEVKKIGNGYKVKCKVRIDKELTGNREIGQDLIFGLEIGVNDFDQADSKRTQHKLFASTESHLKPLGFGRFVLGKNKVQTVQASKNNLLKSEEDANFWRPWRLKVASKETNDKVQGECSILLERQAKDGKTKLSIGKIKCNEGDRYLLSAWAKGEGLSKSAEKVVNKHQDGARLQIHFMNGEKHGKNIWIELSDITDKWEKRELLIRVEKGVTDFIVIAILYDNITGKLFVDDITVEKLN
jgi:cellulose/xylan binding protein with CBM9 domain